jgi:hypothetical protein
MVECDVEVEDVAIFKNTLIGDAVADDFVGGCADGFRKMVVVQRGWVGLPGR